MLIPQMSALREPATGCGQWGNLGTEAQLDTPNEVRTSYARNESEESVNQILDSTAAFPVGPRVLLLP